MHVDIAKKLWASRPDLADDLLSCDVEWFIGSIIASYPLTSWLQWPGVPKGRWPTASDNIAGLFWDVHLQVSD